MITPVLTYFVISKDRSVPSKEDVEECLKIAKEKHCIVELQWYKRWSGDFSRYIKEDMTFEEAWELIPKAYCV